MSNAINDLMNLDPLDQTKADIDAIVAHHRRNRALVDSGEKPTKEKGPKIDISSLIQGLTGTEKPKLKRRV